MKADMQAVIDGVMDHFGGRRWPVNKEAEVQMNNGWGKPEKYEYKTITNSTRDKLRAKLRDDVILLESLVSKNFSWSSWAYGESDNVDGRTRQDWLLTRPRAKV